jgi:hypothetical protein
MELEKINIYRMTHIGNVPHILRNGITHKNSPDADPHFITIGDVSLINNRDKKKVNVDNGDLADMNARLITLGDFIPFYFGVRMPMLLVMQKGGNFVMKATPPQDIVYLVCSVKEIIQRGIDYYFSDGHAIDKMTSFYDCSQVDNLSTIVDRKAVTARYWGGPGNLDIKRKKQAEFLVSEDLPPGSIIGFVCYNDEAKQKLITLGIGRNKIKVFPNAYY